MILKLKKLLLAFVTVMMTLGGLPAYATDNAPFVVTATGVGPTGYLKVIIEAVHNLYRETYPGTTATFIPGAQFGGMVQAAAGKMDIVVGVTPVETSYGIQGKEPFKEPLKGKLYHIGTVLDNTRHYFIADKVWADANGIKSVADLARVKPKVRLALGSLATPYINDTAEAAFKKLGFSSNDIKSWGGTVSYYPSGRGIDDLKDGKIDMQIISTVHPDGRLIDLHRSRPIVWLPISEAVLRDIAPAFEMKVVTLPKSTYSFMTDDQPTLETFAAMLSGTHVSNDTAYKMARSMGENISKMQKIHPALGNLGPQTLVMKSAQVEYHPGALRYYREKGWVK